MGFPRNLKTPPQTFLPEFEKAGFPPAQNKEILLRWVGRWETCNWITRETYNNDFGHPVVGFLVKSLALVTHVVDVALVPRNEDSLLSRRVFLQQWRVARHDGTLFAICIGRETAQITANYLRKNRGSELLCQNLVSIGQWPPSFLRDSSACESSKLQMLMSHHWLPGAKQLGDIHYPLVQSKVAQNVPRFHWSDILSQLLFFLFNFSGWSKARDRKSVV